MRILPLIRALAIPTLLLVVASLPAQVPQGTAFTYQGELRQNGAAVTASVDMVFDLFDAPTGGNAAGPSLNFTSGNGNPVQVQNGIFTVALDFGALAFNTLISDERYLRVTINGNALAPRTKIENAPYALQARTSELAYTVSNASIGTAQIVSSQVQLRVSGTCAVGSSIQSIAQNGTVTCQSQSGGSGTVTSVASGTGLTGGPIIGSGTLAIANGGVGLAQIDNTAVQARITGSCTSAQKVLGVNANGTVTCGTDASGGVGTVTSIASGTGLTGGPISSSGTLAIANGGVGLAQINTNEVQVHLSGACALGEYVRGINANGSLICTAVPGLQRTTTVDGAANVGQYSAIAIGVDGLPVVSYVEAFNSYLYMAQCSNPTCTAHTIRALDATANGEGSYSAIVIGSDGLPVVSYYDAYFGHLKMVRCLVPACLTWTSGAVDATPGVGKYTSIAIGADGFPVVSYVDWNHGYLKVAHCADLGCTTSVTSTIDTLGFIGSAAGAYFTSIKIGADGLPIMSYHDSANLDLKIAHCSNPTCTAAAIKAVDTVGDVGSYASLAIGADGFPIISYYDSTNGDLKAAHCVDVACTATAMMTAMDTVGDVGSYTSIAIGTDGLPIISYQDVTQGDLKLAHCGNAECTGPTTISAGDTSGFVGAFSAIAIGSDGLPVVSYYDGTNAHLKLLKCNNRFCQ